MIDWLIECRFYTFPFLFKQFELTDWLIDWLIDWLNAECWMLLLYFSSCLQAVLSWLIDWMPKGKLETCARYQFSLKERRCKILENTRKMSQGCTILEMVKFVQTSFCEIWKVFHSTRLWLCNIHSKLITEWQSLNGLLSQTNHESDLFQIYSPKNIFLGE